MQLRPWPVVFPLFVATAFGVSLLFDGFEIKYLGAAQSFLVICAIVVICKRYEHGLSLPKTPLLLLITLGSAFYAFYQFFALHQPPRSLFLNINSHAALLNIIALPLAAYCLISYKERRGALSII